MKTHKNLITTLILLSYYFITAVTLSIVTKLGNTRPANTCSSMNRPLKTVIFQASTRTRRIGPKITAAVLNRLQSRRNVGTNDENTPGFDITAVIDPRTWEDGYFMRLLEKPLFHYKQQEDIPAPLRRTGALIQAADLYLVISSEMNHTIPPGLVNTMSHFGSTAYSFRPSGIITYSAGLWGGTRAGVALRPFLAELGCVPVSATVALPNAIKTLGGVVDDTYATTKEEPPQLPEPQSKMLDRMFDQLEWNARVLQQARQHHGPPSESYFQQLRGTTK